MKKLLLLTLALALAPALWPAEASPLTHGQRVSKLEAKLKCIVKTPVSEFAGYANYGDPVVGLNALNVYEGEMGEAPDQLTDMGGGFGLDWNFNESQPDYWVLNVKANNENFVGSSCAKLFPKQVTPAWWGRPMLERLTRARQLARVR